MTLEERLPKGAWVFLAPMAGVTDAPFRDLVGSFRATAMVSEMISSEALVRLNRRTYRRLVSKKENSLKIIQLVGSNPKSMAESAIINEDLGADVVDINMGCPARKVTLNNSGAALMKNEDLAVKIAESVVKSVKIPVTLKMRLGWDSTNINCLSLAKKFEDAGISMLAIHCRTRAQMYSGKADWSVIRELRNIVKIPYLCNGDIKSPEDGVRALEESCARGIMIGRAALGKPWLPNQIIQFLNEKKIIPHPSIDQQFQIIMAHFQAVLDFYGESHGIRLFRKHFAWYSSGLVGSSSFREVISRAEDLSFIKSHVEEFYKKQIQKFY
ncbi:MAG: tRNA dihydrouridine synthase DusB [Holosporaceae bacterium]|jgi:tRNA-dihydrouridine synthase B|nr:tRNA dihydrouridine synthase DusB [Holosporaceae bacterium]